MRGSIVEDYPAVTVAGSQQLIPLTDDGVPPRVLTGKSLWRVRSIQRAALSYSTTVQKPLRLQLKMATVVEKHRLPLWVCCFF